MPSSISPSKARKHELHGTHEGALPAGLRKTASDRPGQAQPVPVRDIPSRPWVKMGSTAFLLVALLLSLWEWQARTNLGLHAGDIDDSPQAWAEQRRLADIAPVTIVGDSRILFDTDLDRFQKLTGVRPIQTAIPGTNARALLASYANDPGFHGLLIVGLADLSYFRPEGVGLGEGYLKGFDKNDKPAQLSGLWIDRLLQHYLAFLDSDYRLSRWGPRFDHGLRAGAYGPYDDVWKISETYDRRQYAMWDRIETDPYLRDHARHAWNLFKGPPLPASIAQAVVANSAEAVRRIRSRGGDVIFVRPPSAPELRKVEDGRLPRAKGWDRLIAGTRARGIHFDDLPAAQGLVLPEWSHLSRKCATVFTDAYVRRLVQLTPRLRLAGNAPPPLTRAYCVPPKMVSAAAAHPDAFGNGGIAG
jgi:hypothetical protein